MQQYDTTLIAFVLDKPTSFNISHYVSSPQWLGTVHRYELFIHAEKFNLQEYLLKTPT